MIFHAAGAQRTISVFSAPIIPLPDIKIPGINLKKSRKLARNSGKNKQSLIFIKNDHIFRQKLPYIH